jgi:hypothetical protein
MIWQRTRNSLQKNIYQQMMSRLSANTLVVDFEPSHVHKSFVTYNKLQVAPIYHIDGRFAPVQGRLVTEQNRCAK